jgi:hypothetical protein
MLIPPAPSIDNGSLSLNLAFYRGRRQMRILFGQRDARNYGELDIRANGRLRIIERRRNRKRRVAAAKRAIPPAPDVDIELRIDGTSIRVLVAGSEVLTGTLSAPNSGTFALQAVASELSVDNVHIRAD